MINLTGPSDDTYGLVFDQIDSTIAGSDNYFEDPEYVTEWAWKHHASAVDSLAQTVLFDFDGTWDDLLDAYLEAKSDDYHESRIG